MKSSLALSRIRRMQGRPYRLKPGTDPAINGVGSETKISRKSAGSPLFSIFLASIVPHIRIEMLNFSDGQGER
jgi:hypothetical protein